MRRAWMLAAALLPLALNAVPEDPAERLPGGAATLEVEGRLAFNFAMPGLDGAENARFAVGNSFFKRNWVQAPASTGARDGLGPHFMARSCGGCHVNDGRGAPPLKRLEQPVSLLFKLAVGDDLEPRYGAELSMAAVDGVPPEAQLRLSRVAVPGQFTDGTPYTLYRPIYRFTQLSNGALHPQVRISPRVAPQLPGVGLIEAIPDAEILANEKAQAAAGGPEQGRAHRVTDAWDGQTRIGRFGWKADAPTLAHQSSAAFNADIGITSRAFPHESCTPTQTACRKAPSGGSGPDGLEIDDKLLGDVVFYQAALAVPSRPAVTPAQQLGRGLFHQARCASCHRPSYTTTAPPFPGLSTPRVQGQRIWPYSDFLLHDMGPGLADAGGAHVLSRLWKTPPLWGIGRIREVNGHQRLLHDGRADGVLEAILWHGGEAEAAKQQVLRMTPAQRRALVAFVESL